MHTEIRSLESRKIKVQSRTAYPFSACEQSRRYAYLLNFWYATTRLKTSYKHTFHVVFYIYSLIYIVPLNDKITPQGQKKYRSISVDRSIKNVRLLTSFVKIRKSFLRNTRPLSSPFKFYLYK